MNTVSDLLTSQIPAVESIVVLIITIYLVIRFADKKRTPFWCYVLTIFGWSLGFSMIIFVPLDLYLTLKNGVASSQLIVWWQIFYWTSFILN